MFREPTMKCDLHRFFGEMASSLPVEERQSFTFSVKSFAEIPDRLETDQLVIAKAHHDYDGAFRMDMLKFFAEKTTYLELGLLMLSVVFRPGGARVHVGLTNAASTVRNLVIQYGGNTTRVSGHQTLPEAFVFYPGEVCKHPWVHQNLDSFGLPRFALTNLEECVVTDQDWALRDTVFGFGNDDASVRLAGLLLKLGSPRNETNEVVLEGEGGFRGVGVHSAEAAFYLPGSLAWSPSMLSEKS